jgi:molecular chaperone HtpG
VPRPGSESERRETLLSLIRLRSTAGDQFVSLANYVGRMKPGQDAIFYITGDDIEALKKSPQLERFAARGGADLAKVSKPDGGEAKSETTTPGVDSLVAMFQLTLKEAVKDVRPSERLIDSAVCLVADEGDMDMHLERMLKQHRQLDAGFKRVLEVNPRHPLVVGWAKRVSEKGSADEVAEAAWLLLDQARIVGGEPLPDPAAFSKRLSDVMRRALAA